jgi:predicted amidohydrolase YtcJ
MIILSDNIFDLKPEDIRNVKVETTIVGGKVVFGGGAQSVTLGLR